MADYAKTECVVLYSASSDYTNPAIAAAISKAYSTPTERLDLLITTTTSAVTATISSVASPSAVVIQNLDSSIAITAVYRTGGGGATDQTIAIPAGEWVKLVDVTSSANISLDAASGTPLARVIVFGAS